ncbi:phage tail tube protein [Clostridium autoethanogenum]|uniref:Phage tail tube protein n=1 Tax=Clostridium autoethanogenum DSM 10061 TaxID=1341692 RepID=A0ABN4BKY0_9CLOT|nr:phage tail tube protein [Clostridium autoethanogenum]AGY77989.1 phage tail tube protein [Clostridium autoethanogenum DSM 10061]ALU38123.1 XkdM protein phage-like element PBSX [Clostridium autoethanogenum DSM 10061]OVY50887.1 hypothetical protein WX72_02048 [Clostridium autoethanogenum]
MAGNLHVLSGSNGKIWCNGDRVPGVTKWSCKIQAKTDDVVECGEWGTGTNITGMSVSGTLTLDKKNSYLIKEAYQGISGGAIPDIKLISGAYDEVTKQTERWSITGIVFTEIDNNFESQKNTSQEFPFNALMAKPIETID